MNLRLRAPAKINWTLEVLAKRPSGRPSGRSLGRPDAQAGGYHEVRTLLQTIDLCDWVTVTPADEISLALRGEIDALAGEPPEANLAYRAAARLQGRTGRHDGVRIELEKAVPVAAGLGGGSSDAAAVLRGLCRLWKLDLSDDDLAPIAAELGSDVPFFLRGGAALASGRGELIEPLPDGPRQRVTVAWPRPRLQPDKTARMYAALRPEHDTDGSRTDRLAARLRTGQPVRDEDIYNVFEAVLPEVDQEGAAAFERAAALGIGQPHLCGSGPAFYFLLDSEQAVAPLLDALTPLDLQAQESHTIGAADAATSIEEQ